jgi:hypothetical protein
MTLTEIETAWLNHAWTVVNCPPQHRQACIALGGATSGPGRVQYNDILSPGYLGRNYDQGRVLCMGAAGREPSLQDEQEKPNLRKTASATASQIREWTRQVPRTVGTDEAFLRSFQATSEEAWRQWPRLAIFRRLFAGLGIDSTQVAWSNLAKCRANDGLDSAHLTKLCILCQHQFPVAELVEAIRPVAVLICVIAADPSREGEVVATWKPNDGRRPYVFAFEGRNGRDVKGRKMDEWELEVVPKVRRLIKKHGTQVP